jgi:hypothetical protein
MKAWPHALSRHASRQEWYAGKHGSGSSFKYSPLTNSSSKSVGLGQSDSFSSTSLGAGVVLREGSADLHPAVKQMSNRLWRARSENVGVKVQLSDPRTYGVADISRATRARSHWIPASHEKS